MANRLIIDESLNDETTKKLQTETVESTTTPTTTTTTNKKPIESIEHLHSLKYNYGKLKNSNCTHLSRTNRLALCTDKCVLILNLNLNWPSAQTGTLPAKFMINYKKITSCSSRPTATLQTASNVDITTTDSTSSQYSQSKHPSIILTPNANFNKQTFQIESWIQDLTETKNDLLYINLIRSIEKSTKIENIYKNFFKIDELPGTKRQSFHRSIKETIYLNSKSSTNKKKLDKLNKRSLTVLDLSDDDDVDGDNGGGEDINRSYSIAKKTLIESNLDEYFKQKQLTDQLKLYDPSLFNYLSFLSPYTNPNNNNAQNSQQQTNNQNHEYSSIYFYNGFSKCKWNRRYDLELLCALTNSNQLILFNLTRFKSDNRVNAPPPPTSSSSHANDSYIKIFDTRSNSKQINLTEFYLLEEHADLQDLKVKSLDEFIFNLSKLVPISFKWSTNGLNLSKLIKNEPNLIVEFLFVLFKSNELVTFLILTTSDGTPNSDDNLNVECLFRIDLDDRVDLIYQEDNQERPHQSSSTEAQENCDSDDNENESKVKGLFNSNEKLRLKLSSFDVWTSKFSQNEILIILVVAYTNGRVLLTHLDLIDKEDFQLSKEEIKKLKFFKIKNLIRIGSIESLSLFKLNVNANGGSGPSGGLLKFLILIKHENLLEFLIVEYNTLTKQFRQETLKPIYFIQNETTGLPFGSTPQRPNNFLIKNNSRLIDVILTNSNLTSRRRCLKKPAANCIEMTLEFLVYFENSLIKQLNLSMKFVADKLTDLNISKCFIVNETVELKLNVNDDTTSNNTSSALSSVSSSLSQLDGSNLFKLTNNLFINESRYLAYQVNDYSKLELIEKKPKQLEINIYRLNSYDNLTRNYLSRDKIKEFIDLDDVDEEEEEDTLIDNQLGHQQQRQEQSEYELDTNNCELNKSLDLIWLFKRELFLNREFFNESLFDYLNSCFKKARKLLNNVNFFSGSYYSAGNNDAIGSRRHEDGYVVFNKKFQIYLKRLRILSFYLSGYFEMASKFEFFNQIDQNENDDNADEDDDDVAMEEYSEIIEPTNSSFDEKKLDDSLSNQAETTTTTTISTTISNSSIKPKTSIESSPQQIQKTQSSSVIRSVSYYLSIFRELTLGIFKSHALSLILHSCSIGFTKLNNKERVVLLLIGDFSIKKNFLYNCNLGLACRSGGSGGSSSGKMSGGKSTKTRQDKSDDQKLLENWFDENFFNNNKSGTSTTSTSNQEETTTSSDLVTSSTSSSSKKTKSKNNKVSTTKTNVYSKDLVDLLNELNCDLCGKQFKIDESNELSSVVCEMGHRMSRCEKSLLPLNNFKYNKCSYCDSSWNLFNKVDYPNFSQLHNNQSKCLFCD